MEKFNEDDGVWRTISGRKVFIRDGESLSSAMSRSGKFSKMSRVEKNKDKYDKIDKFKKRKATNKFEEPEPKKKEKIHLVKDKDNRYVVSRGEDDNTAIENYKRNYGDDKERQELTSEERRSSLMKFTQENKDKIRQWANEYDEETNKRAFEKARQGEGLTAKEYFGFIGSEFKPGSVINEQFADGENAVVAKDGNWVRESRIKAYNENPRENQDAIYDDEKETRLKWDKEERENPRISVEEMRKKYENQKNPFRDDEYTRKELEKEKINDFKAKKQSNIKVSYQKNWSKDGTTMTQSVKIDNDTKNKINEAIKNEIASGYKNYKNYASDINSARMYLEKLNDDYTDTNLTTNRFIQSYLKDDKIKKDRNTRYIIK